MLALTNDIFTGCRLSAQSNHGPTKRLVVNLSKTPEDLDFADDIGLLSHYFKHIQEKSQRLSKVALQTGLDINTQKTKGMRIIPATNTLIQIAEQNIEYVEGFIYPGSIISKTGGTKEDIKSRIGKA